MSSSKLSRACAAGLEAGWLLAVVTTPLFISLYTSRSIEPDKLSVLRIIATSMSVVWLIGFIERRQVKPEQAVYRAPLFVPTAALVGVYGLATVTSLVPRISWSGAYPRPEGAYAILCYAVIFMI
ncbi:MAG: hypothetical protein HY870_09135, partial [Chloroflexi bacterium]|nr:hypothetical protein [Chloroflexota bacterium]